MSSVYIRCSARRSDGRFDTKPFVLVVVAAVVLSTRAVLLAVQVQVVFRVRRVQLARRASVALIRAPFVRRTGSAHGRAGLAAPAVRGPPPPAGLAPEARDRGRHGDGEQYGRRAAQHAHVQEARAALVRAVDRVLVEAQRTVRHAVAPERRANARVQFRAPVHGNRHARTRLVSIRPRRVGRGRVPIGYTLNVYAACCQCNF